MNPRSLLFAAFALLFAAGTTAQASCPMKQAEHVPESLTVHGALPCSGGTVSFGGLTLTSPSSSCPMFATHTMPHEIEVPAQTQTMVDLTGQASVWIYYFECQREWILILPWGSSCVMKSRNAGHDLPRYRTVPCLPSDASPADQSATTITPGPITTGPITTGPITSSPDTP